VTQRSQFEPDLFRISATDTGASVECVPGVRPARYSASQIVAYAVAVASVHGCLLEVCGGLMWRGIAAAVLSGAGARLVGGDRNADRYVVREYREEVLHGW